MNSTSPIDTPVEHPPTTFKYLPGLDGVRAISVLAVMVFHHYVIGGSEPGWAPGGFLGVEVFFVVSGYLITALLLTERRETGVIGLRQFYVRRARRLLPALYVLLAIVTAYALLFLPDAISALKGDVVAALTYTSNWWQIIQDRSYFAEAGRPALLKHLWSLAIEEQFYIVWPAALMFGLRRFGRQRTLIATIVVAMSSYVAMIFVVHFGSIDHAYYGTYTRMGGLLLGAAFAFVFAPYRIRGLPGHGARIALDTAGVLGLVFLLATFGVLKPFIGFNGFTFPASQDEALSVFHFGFLFVDIATLLVIAAVVHPASDLGRILGCAPLVWVGKRSYGLYLWHYPIMCITRPGLDFNGFFHLRGWPVFVIRTGLSFLAAELSYRFVETPIRQGAFARYRERLSEARGEPKQRLVRRGAVIGGALLLGAAMLGTGLAAAQPQKTELAGSASDDGSKIDPCILAQLEKKPAPAGCATTTTAKQPATTVTPTTNKTGTTTPGKGTVKPPGKGTTTTTAKPSQRGGVLAIGDSVMLGAAGTMRNVVPGITVDAIVSRQPGHGAGIMEAYKGALALPDDVVIHLGTNGRLTPEMFDAMMNAAQGRQVYWITARVPRVWEAESNASIRQGVPRYKNAHLLDWKEYAGCHDDWFVNDGFHLRTPGQTAYSYFIRDGLNGVTSSKCVK
jgi:peptidoglycan/LPS O-acetylase OafA/YrhL